MKVATYLGGVLGIMLLIALGIQADVSGMLRAFRAGGFTLAWLLPFRSVFFALYAMGWWLLIDAIRASHRASFGYLLWATSVREAVDRLLPVASVGGSLLGIRLLRWRGLDVPAAGATVLIEVVTSLMASYAFAAAGLALLASSGTEQHPLRIITPLLLALPVPVTMFLLLRYGAPFQRFGATFKRILGREVFSGGAGLDGAVSCLLSRHARVLGVGLLELGAMASGSVEIWFAMRLFGHPVTMAQALILESMTGALRHVAFFVPGGIGVQEATLVLFGKALGIGGEFALAVSMVKRLREILLGVPCLLSWQWLEGRRLSGMRAA